MEELSLGAPHPGPLDESPHDLSSRGPRSSPRAHLGSLDEVASWTPGTKFLRPPLGPDIAVDPALVAAVRTGLDAARLTLITAQAGAGKTTLAAAALAAAPHLSVAWISLDSGDDSLDSLLHLLDGAFQRAMPGDCPAFHDLLRLRLPAAADARRAIGVLVNDLLAAGAADLVLVLDDVDALRRPDVAAALDYLVAYAPPGMRLLATARGDPPLALARLRAQGHLHEVGGEALRLTLPQTEELLNRRLGLKLPAGAVAAIASGASGWVTGVRLLAQAHSRGAAPGAESLAGAAGIAGVTGMPGAGPEDDRDAVYDFLTEEILRHEPADVQRFLLDTAVLDEVTPAAAAAVSGRTDAGRLLMALHRRHHFLIDRSGPTSYRYHQLLSAVLRRLLGAGDPERVAQLHRRAAAAVEHPGTRIEHLLAAGESEQAAALVERLGRDLFAHPAQTGALNAWVDRLPQAVRHGRPWIAVVRALDAFQRGDLTPLLPELERALDDLATTDDYLGQWLAARLLAFAHTGRGRAADVLVALEASPGFAALPTAAQVDHYVNAAYSALHRGRWDDVPGRLAAALDMTMATGDAAAVEVLAQHLSPLLAMAEGAIERIESYAAWTVRRFPAAPPVIRLGLAHQETQLHFLRGRLEEAYAAATQARTLHERLGGLPFVRATLDWVQASRHFARGERGAARAVLERRAGDPDTASLDQRLGSSYLALLARVLRAEGRVDEVSRMASGIASRTASSRYAEAMRLVRLSVGAHAAWAAGDRAGAAALLREALPLEDDLRLAAFVGSPRLDLAVVLFQLGQPSPALRELAIGLAATAGRGLPGLVAPAGPEIIPLLELARERGVRTGDATAALHVFGQRPPPTARPVPGSTEVLSSREVEVLRLLAAGASNRDVAAALVVSANTVKTHVSRVLAKLGARSRAEAAARARDLDLL